LLADVAAPWYIAGGWALDLFRGRQRRHHGDLEIGVPAPEFEAIRKALAGYDFRVAGSGRLWPLDSPAFGMMFQTWVSEPETGVFRLDVFREPQRDGAWVCRRDETIRLPFQEIISRTGDGIPFLVPEIVLLFKAKHSGVAKHQTDFDATLPLLDDAALGWLERSLRRIHPSHAWLGAVAGARGRTAGAALKGRS